MKNQARKAPSKRRPGVSRADRRQLPSHSALVIVGIGASAGGLEALIGFLGNVKADSGMAFVVIQHLDPTVKGMLPELLQRSTRIKVIQAKDGARVNAGCAYVIPPNKDLSLLRGRLHLLDPVAPRGLRLPIDFFFRSLAEEQRELSVGIILSGMGSDGTLGLRAIKEHSGVALVQEPSTAKFDGMPRNAIDAELADFVGPAEELPAKLADYVRHMPRIQRSDPPIVASMASALDKVIILLRSNTGHDFSSYRKSTLYRRVVRRMGIHQIAKVTAYVRYLQENPQECGILFKELLIGVTSFFRDRAAWEQLGKKALPALMASRPAGSTLRAWIAGCSTGEEAYSLAMLFKETQSRLKPRKNISLQIYATDLDRDAIDKARLGAYPETIAADISSARLARFFVKEESGFRVNKEIRSMVIFAPQNLIMDPPFTKLDMFSCRNLLIYLSPELQKRLIPLFHYILMPGGLLFLGSSESVGSFTSLFAAVAAKERIFRRREAVPDDAQLGFPSLFSRPPASPSSESETPEKPAASLQSLADQMLRTRYAPPAALVNDEGDIVYISGHTGRFLEPAAGKANWNIVAMAREGLQHDLSDALQRANRTRKPVTVRGIRVGAGSEERTVDLYVQPLEEPRELMGMALVVFGDAALPIDTVVKLGPKAEPASASRHGHLERQLKHARDEAKSNREEMQTSQEELKSINEELQSTNEELQSTNEELTTSKEEMQSLNEELQTVNAELQSKLDELSSSNNDMKNLLNSTDIATLFLDNALCVRRFTLQAKTIFKLIPGDVGRPITDLSSNLLYSGLAADAKEVLRTLVVKESSSGTKDGRWFSTRIMPYRTLDNRIDGVVITFANITDAKNLEADLRGRHRDLERSSARQALANLDPKVQAQPRVSNPGPKTRITRQAPTLPGKGSKP